MRILLVHNYYRRAATSGEDRVFENERRLLESRGHGVETVCADNDDLASQGVARRIAVAASSIWNEPARRRLVRLLSAYRPDVVHVHNLFPQFSPSILQAARSAGAATVATLHNYRMFCAPGTCFRNDAPCTQCIERRSAAPGLLNRCYRGGLLPTLPIAATIGLHRRLHTWLRCVDAFICLTEFQRGNMIRAGLPPGSLHVIPNMAWDPGPVPARERRSDAVFIGRLGPEKGARILISAWEKWGARAPRLEIVGGGIAEAGYRGFIESRGLSGKISITGIVPHEEVGRRLARGRMLIVPSLCFEGFPLAMAEAMSQGVPIAGSALGSVECILKAAGCGVSFAPRSPEALLDAVRALWDDHAALRAFGAAGRAYYERFLSPGAHYAQLLGAYSAAMLRSRQSREAA